MPEPATLLAVGGSIFGLATHLARRYFEVAKEVLDVVLGFIALVLCLPILLFCAAIIKFNSKGPVFFRQVRAGKGNKPFVMYKLRSMYIDAEEASGAVWASKNDSRVIKGCRWMRLCHADELPQLINVIKGEMSLVGPRPLPLDEVHLDAFAERQRLIVKPGITCLWQISGRNRIGFEDWMKLDLEYLDNWSLWLDFKILMKTIPVVLFGIGAC